jgi:hypothetical protein
MIDPIDLSKSIFDSGPGAFFAEEEEMYTDL